MILETKYNFGDIVFCKTDPNQNPWMVIGANFYPNGLRYICEYDQIESYFYDFQLTNEENVLIRLGLKEKK